VNRREIIALLWGTAAVSWPGAVWAQLELPKVVYLGSTNPHDDAFRVNAFRDGLSAGGYVADRNILIDYVWAEGRYDRMPELVADIVRRKPSLIAAMGTTAAGKAVKAAGITIPTVFLTGGDPVEHGLVPNLNHPGGNLTGVSILVNTTWRSNELWDRFCRCIPPVRYIRRAYS
jgi:ABC transporter substrate binding protein